MKTLSCKDMGVDCNFVSRADTTEESVKMTAAHAMKAHAAKVAEMSKMVLQEEITAAMMAKVKDM